ncbi:uncharacterized protein LOC111012146 isoform X2 [Momordica charantia]|uniref:Uncharacterized protein LOC111012146 isoform X2 n=1 Tax=Momordica charantia TaxID=3673 RepID=A0A6J1CL49_MOMCH|nr:uncharacterized protein LOC111012146 isoform X2 [Momordica charantia]
MQSLKTPSLRPPLRIDEWRNPSHEALAGGRGMFCIVPLAKTLVSSVSQMVNVAATSTVKALEKPELLSPQVLQAGLHERLEKFLGGLQKANSPSLPTTLHLHDERMDRR